MLVLKRACFIHVPKTGGTWVKSALQSARVEFEEFAINDDIHVGIRHCPWPERVKFGFVRHPFTFYRSYWQFKMIVGWDRNNAFDEDCNSSNFQSFIENATRKHRGFLGSGIDELLGTKGNEIEFIGKYENLVEDLITALQISGETFDANAIRATSPRNVTDRNRFPATFTEDLKSKILESERTMMERFNYVDVSLATINEMAV